MYPIIEPGSLERLPILPLPDVVLFPHTLLPLHVFEPRYRKMTSDILREKGPLAVVQLQGESCDEMGRPAIRSVAGVGQVLEHLKLSDGRFFILVAGIIRVRIREELESSEPYRLVRADPLENEYPLTRDTLISSQLALQTLLISLGKHWPEASSTLLKLCESTSDPGVLTDASAALLVPDSLTRQRLLETPDVGHRLTAMIDVLAERLGNQMSREVDTSLLN